MCHKLHNDTNRDVTVPESPYRKLKAPDISSKTKRNHQNQTHHSGKDQTHHSGKDQNSLYWIQKTTLGKKMEWQWFRL